MIASLSFISFLYSSNLLPLFRLSGLPSYPLWYFLTVRQSIPYTFGEIRDVAEQWSIAIEAKNKYVENKEGSAEEFWESHHEYDSAVDEYRKISGYLARIEHFALGVNTGIYDAKVTERAATTYFVMLYSKLIPILAVKNCGSARDTDLNNSFHTEFSTLVERIRTLEKNN